MGRWLPTRGWRSSASRNARAVLLGGDVAVEDELEGVRVVVDLAVLCPDAIHAIDRAIRPLVDHRDREVPVEPLLLDPHHRREDDEGLASRGVQPKENFGADEGEGRTGDLRAEGLGSAVGVGVGERGLLEEKRRLLRRRVGREGGFGSDCGGGKGQKKGADRQNEHGNSCDEGKMPFDQQNTTK